MGIVNLFADLTYEGSFEWLSHDLSEGILGRVLGRRRYR
jgi:hypothetical protein